MDHRPIWVQVKSGFRIGGLIVLVFCFLGALGAALSYVNESLNSKDNHLVVAGSVVAILIAIMVLTVQYWAKWLLGVFALVFLRGLGALVFKSVFSQLWKDISIEQLIIVVVYLLAAIGLTATHFQRKPKGVERFGLVSFVVCAMLAMIRSSYIPAMYGLASLALTKIAQRWLLHGIYHRPAHKNPPGSNGST
jgi:hypothetical protein